MKAVVFHGVGDIRLEEVAEVRVPFANVGLIKLPDEIRDD